MVFIILNPIISGIDKFDIDNILEFDRNYKTQETSVSNDDILSLYSKAMETDIKEKFDNIKDITIVFSENLEEIENIEIIIHDGETKVNEIKYYIKENYQVSENIISIIS